LANRPTNRHKDTLKYKKTGHNNGEGLSFNITVVVVVDMYLLKLKREGDLTGG